jgi:alpha-glucosidase
MIICNTAIRVYKENNYFVVETNGVCMHLWFLTNDIVRIRAGFDGDFAEASYSLMLTAWEDRLDALFSGQRRRVQGSQAELTETASDFVLQGEKLRVVIDKQPLRISIYDSVGTCLHADIADLCYMEDSNHRRIHTSEIFPDDCFYGFGEKSGGINKRGRFMTMSPGDAMGYDPKHTDSLYKHIPFYIKLNRSTHKAAGYFYHNTSECDFNMGREKRNYWKPYSRYRADGGDIDLFFIAGPKVAEVIERYTDLTGKSAMLPRYALGYLGSSMYYSELDEKADEAIEGFIDTNKEEGIPIDGFQLSSGYTVQPENKRCVFTWNRRRFAEPQKFFAEMESRGVTVSPNVKPGLLLMHPLLEALKEKDIFVKKADGTGFAEGTWWGGKGLFADFTSPQTRAVWKQYLKKEVLEIGTSSVWNDNCEYDSLVDKDSCVSFEGVGGTIGQLKAVMPNLMCRITEEAIRETFSGKRPYIVCRSGYSGIQQYAQTWAGDNLTCWDALKYNIATILGMSVSGVANQGCDIGGFYGPAPEEELFVRWVQNGIFQPRFSIHSTNTDNTVTEPWMYSRSKKYIQEAIQFRYKLIPYAYSLMARAHVTGLPIMQPMFAAFQQDSRCYDEGVDFMLGDSLLVANVVDKGAVVRRVYLPAGEVFYDFYTREKYEGGQIIEVPVDLSSIPLFLRGGSILLLAGNTIGNLHADEVTSLHLLVAPDHDAQFTLYEDDGSSLDYEKGVFRRTRIEAAAGECVAIRFQSEGSYTSPLQDIFMEVIRRDKSPYWVTVDGRRLPHFLHRVKFEQARSGWYYSQTLKTVQVKYPCQKKDYEVMVSFEQFDLIGM